MPSLAHHEDVIRMGGSVSLVHRIVPLVQEFGIGAGRCRINPYHRIQTESVHTHIHPFPGRFHGGLERAGVLALVRLSVVQVRHTGVEARIIGGTFAKNDIGRRAVVQREGFA